MELRHPCDDVTTRALAPGSKGGMGPAVPKQESLTRLLYTRYNVHVQCTYNTDNLCSTYPH